MRRRNHVLSPATSLLATVGALSALIAANPARAQVDLTGTYRASNGATLTRKDGSVNFNWGTKAPASDLPQDYFEATWTGKLLAPKTGDYQFSTESDDGVRLWVNGKLIIDNWVEHSRVRDNSGLIRLQAGTEYDIKLEYYETWGDAVIRLLWTPPGEKLQVIPRRTTTTTPPAAVPAPTNLTAIGQAVASSSSVALTWNPVTEAARYNIYRDSKIVKQGVAGATNWQDTGVVCGTKYTYTVTAVASDSRESSQSTPATATPPTPTVGGVFSAPTNLRVKGVWTTSGPSDQLAWTPVPGAVSYNVYLYDAQIANGVKTTSYAVPPAQFHEGMTYTVTAVNADGAESFPSNIVAAQGKSNPTLAAIWLPPAPAVPQSVTVAPEWNAGAPRVTLQWKGDKNALSYNVYRDGQQIAEGVWGLTYVDNTVTAGKSYSYTLTSINYNNTLLRESVKSVAVKAIAPSAAPARLSSPVQITNIKSNDDSALISFASVPGAKDYRVYEASAPTKVKYSGGGLSIEWNGMDPTKSVNLVVEAVDKLGPFQKMDGMMGPGTMMHDGTARIETNGQGDPSNVPNVIAASAPFAVTFKPFQLTGAQAFFDTFRNSSPFVAAPVPAGMLQESAGRAGALANDKWVLYNVLGDLASSQVFIMGNHFMDTLYDGGTPFTNDPLHNDNASIVMMPRATADISGNRVLHVTFEVDAHFNPRRWCDVMIAGADDALLNPGKFAENNLMPTVSGQVFRWEIKDNVHTAQRFHGMDSSGNLVKTELFDLANGVGEDNFGPAARITWDGKPAWNGTLQDLDKRHKFDLFLSRNRFQVWEEGVLIKDRTLPAGAELPFSRVAVYYIHQAYHTSLDREELVEYSSEKAQYWINHRPYADERHWDNMGFEVLNSFPTTLQP